MKRRKRYLFDEDLLETFNDELRIRDRKRAKRKARDEEDFKLEDDEEIEETFEDDDFEQTLDSFEKKLRDRRRARDNNKGYLALKDNNKDYLVLKDEYEEEFEDDDFEQTEDEDEEFKELIDSLDRRIRDRKRRARDNTKGYLALKDDEEEFEEEILDAKPKRKNSELVDLVKKSDVIFWLTDSESAPYNFIDWGYNAGTYGWNWSAFTQKIASKLVVILCGRRGIPAIVEKRAKKVTYSQLKTELANLEKTGEVQDEDFEQNEGDDFQELEVRDKKRKTRDSFRSFNSLYDSTSEELDDDHIQKDIVNSWKNRH